MKTLLTVSLLALLPTAAATTYPLTLTDDLGRKVTLRSEPKRIISMVPSHSETVCAIGACGKLVGVDKYSDYPQQVARLPKVGDLFAPDVEAMVALKPDLVLVSKYSKLDGPLTQAGIPTIALDMEKYDEVFSKTLTLGRIVNREAQAKNVVLNIRRDIAKVEILTKNAVRKPTAYFEIDPTPYSIGPNSFMGVLLTKAGARNIIPASLGDFPKVDPELIVKANPELMLGLTRQAAAARPGWSGLKAVKAGRVLDIPKDLNTILSRPGPRMGQALRGLARLVHPELFR
ncbi:iron complex transport system substrate-binding protein [Deinococcus sp. HSC-46F16]|uniref:ABC transporter substrate-binding protein n=1 Tax=Deinococcus sp. HSC-46F16 TaxID=2910968 RepID=UPI00209C8004|nr:ABC transporter substrate-binding protein [Deinococcus sp. HSC-46F16]MCP2015189.1 iron complex transport system substrate-binding protein [Deinococcus sp. HSC-46F16]